MELNSSTEPPSPQSTNIELTPLAEKDATFPLDDEDRTNSRTRGSDKLELEEQHEEEQQLLELEELQLELEQLQELEEQLELDEKLELLEDVLKLLDEEEDNDPFDRIEKLNVGSPSGPNVDLFLKKWRTLNGLGPGTICFLHA